MLQNQRDLLGPERAEQLSRHLALLDSSRRVHPLPQSALGGATEDRVDGAAKLVEALRGQLAALRLEQALDAGGGHLLQRQLVQLGEKSLSEEAFEGCSRTHSSTNRTAARTSSAAFLRAAARGLSPASPPCVRRRPRTAARPFVSRRQWLRVVGFLPHLFPVRRTCRHA